MEIARPRKAKRSSSPPRWRHRQHRRANRQYSRLPRRWIAGTDEKCAWITRISFDAAVNYKHPDWKKNSPLPLPKHDIDFEMLAGESCKKS